jgi:gamma-glutamylputrescine oxidase
VLAVAKPKAFPAKVDVQTADVVVVGGGLTGVLTATALRTTGRKVVLLEAARLGGGASSAAPGMTGLLLATEYRGLEATHGRRIARVLMTSVAAAGTSLATSLKRAGIRGAGDVRLLLSMADGSTKNWDRDVAARAAAGLRATAVSGAALARITTADADAALKIEGAGLAEPARVLAGAIAKLASARVTTFEKSRVTRITFTRTDATVHVGAQSIVTPRVVVCTDAPGTLAPTLDRHVRGFARYHVLTTPMPAAMRKAVGLTSTIVHDANARVSVTATPDGRLLLTGGEGPILAERQRPAAIVQRTGQLMYECLKRFPVIVGLMPESGWSTNIVAGPDRFPLVGPHRQYPHQLFAFGTDRDPALAWLASRVLVRAVEGDERSDDEALGFGRVQEDRS